MRAGRHTIAHEYCEKRLDVQERIWKKEGLVASSSPYLEEAFPYPLQPQRSDHSKGSIVVRSLDARTGLLAWVQILAY